MEHNEVQSLHDEKEHEEKRCGLISQGYINGIQTTLARACLFFIIKKSNEKFNLRTRPNEGDEQAETRLV
jgi:hypothetical protein